MNQHRRTTRAAGAQSLDSLLRSRQTRLPGSTGLRPTLTKRSTTAVNGITGAQAGISSYVRRYRAPALRAEGCNHGGVRLAAVVPVLWLLVACGGVSRRSAQADPCHLVTAPEAARVLGVDSATHETLPSLPSQPQQETAFCLYLGQGGHPVVNGTLPSLDLTLDTRASASAAFDAEASGVGLVAGPNGPVSTRVNVTRVQINGDKGVWNPVTTTLSVLHHGQLLHVTVLGVQAPQGVAESAARVALARF